MSGSTLAGAGTGGLATAGASNDGGGKTHVGGTTATAGAGMNGGSAGTTGSDPTGGTATDAGAGNVSGGGSSTGGSSTGGDPGMGGAGDGTAGGGGDPAMAAPCGNVASGSHATRVRFRDLDVPYGTSCESEQQQASCADGVLGAWSGSFVQESCSPLPPSDCEAAANGAYAERTRFDAASVAYGQKCKSEKQAALCTNGALGAWSGSFAFENCAVQPPANCGATLHGSYAKRTRYFQAEEPFGGSCNAEAQQALCSNGTLGAWSGAFAFDVCQVGPAADCDAIPHGKSEEQTRYGVTSVTYGEVCPKEVQTHTCDNGFWSDWTGTYVYESCEVAPPQPCDGQLHGTVQSYTAYAQYSVEFGASCLSEVRTRVCNNGAWSTWTGSYDASTCSVQECAIGTKQTRSCGLNNRGTQSRSCLSAGPYKGSWDFNWDACVDPDVCKDGAYVDPVPCNGGFGWEHRSCAAGQYELSGTCGSCSGTFVDPCNENKTADSCGAARYEGLSCYGGFFAAAPRCRFTSPFKTTCYDFHEPTFCTPTFGCSWTPL